MEERPNVVLLVFDTLRPDFLSCYGGDVETAAIDSVAERGTVFERAYATGPGTPISHAGLFSGRYPSETGVIGSEIDLPADVPVIASWLRDAGYETLGVPGPAKTSSDFGFDRGFDEYFETYYEIPLHGIGDVASHVRRLLTDSELRKPRFEHLVRSLRYGPDETRFKFELLARRTRSLDAPFFAFANVTTVHMPYRLPPSYVEAAIPEIDLPGPYVLQEFTDARPTIARDDVRMDRLLAAQSAEGVAQFLADPDWLSEAELDVLREWYRASIRYLDDELSRLFDSLEDSGLADDTVVVLTADHGEHFGEHDLLVHGYGMFDECLHVPLVVAGPGVPESRRPEFVSHVDVFATICDLVGLEPPEGTSGWSAFGDDAREFVVAENGIRRLKPDGHGKYMDPDLQTEFELGRKSIRTDDYLYVYTSDGGEELYERPGEHRVEEPDPDVTDRLRERLFETITPDFEVSAAGAGKEELTDEVERNLRELGYIG